MTWDWASRAACAGVDPELFFPDAGQGQIRDYTRARAICSRCPVLTDCRDWNDRMERGKSWTALRECGMYHGETPWERIKRRRQERLARLASS